MSGEEIRSYRDLLVWRQAMTLAKDCYLLTRQFPIEERYGMLEQMRRAATSIPANIAEGSGRGTRKEYLQFLRISLGSLRELETFLILCIEVELTTSEHGQPLLMQTESVSKLLLRLIRSLKP